MKPKTKERTIAPNELYPDQSIELLQELHILTRDGKLNQDSKRKLKQIKHLVQFIEPVMHDIVTDKNHFYMVDFGAGKSYLGFILYDWVAKNLNCPFRISGIEIRQELVEYSKNLANRLDFPHMEFMHLRADLAAQSLEFSQGLDLVTALHACDTATDDAIAFAVQKKVPYLAIVPCCQAEVAQNLRKNKSSLLKNNYFSALFKFPIHTREFGSHLTNVLRCLYLESQSYEVTVTELVGWEHSMKNELILAKKKPPSNANLKAKEQLHHLLEEFQLESLKHRFQ
jgi:hypothetical protein